MKENEKLISYGLRLASIQWPKDLKEEGETNACSQWQKKQKGE